MNPTDRPTLYVLSSLTGKTRKLVDFVADLLLDSPSPPTSQFAEVIISSRAQEAWDSIRRSMDHNQPLKAEDVKYITPKHWLNIYQQGDIYVYTLIERIKSEDIRSSFSDEWDNICCFRGRITRSIPCTGYSPSCPFRSDEKKREDAWQALR